MQHQALGSPGLPKNICKLCGRSEVTVESWSADRTERIGVKVVPVPDDYPYCYTCHVIGDARTDQASSVREAVTAVTGTPMHVWNTGGGTMTGFVELFSDSEVYASFGIVHDDDTVESVGEFGLELWGDLVDSYQVMHGEDEGEWGDHDVDWISPLFTLWWNATSQINPKPTGEFWTADQVGQWFRLVWDETVRTIDENRDKWEVK